MKGEIMKKKTISEIPSNECCFVICPIGKVGTDVRMRADRVFDNIIEPAARENNLVPIRSDHITDTGIITNQIINHLKDDRLVVADLTGFNPNVFYELALRHAAFKPVVQLIEKNQEIPFDVNSIRHVEYVLSMDELKNARKAVSDAITSCLHPEYKVESPVSLAADMNEFYATASSASNKDVMKTLARQLDNISIAVADISNRIGHPDFFKDAIPPHIRDQIDNLLKRYSYEIDILQEIRDAGIIGVYRRREKAFDSFIAAIDDEDKEIMVVGSSMKGLLQNDDFKEARQTLKFKINSAKVRVKFLLTHPAFADFRAKQERREPTEIGKEILSSLRILKEWEIKPSDVKLYMGTPTSFAMITSKKMLVNPYPYMFQAYNSPCFVLTCDHGPHGCYIYDEFKAHHFGAWDTEMAVPVIDFDQEIERHESRLQSYYKNIGDLFSFARNA